MQENMAMEQVKVFWQLCGRVIGSASGSGLSSLGGAIPLRELQSISRMTYGNLMVLRHIWALLYIRTAKLKLERRIIARQKRRYLCRDASNHFPHCVSSVPMFIPV